MYESASQRIPNRKKRHGNVTDSKASVADTLHGLLICKGSKGCDNIVYVPIVRKSWATTLEVVSEDLARC